MRPYTRSVIELFDSKKRYLIPLYQRQYAWKVNPQLELLWEDIERAVDRLEANRTVRAPHFMGAIVISQIQTFGTQVQAYEVIDGQQRLTTFQLLLAAFRDVARKFGSDYASEVNKHLLNDGIMEDPLVERFKLWPSMADRRSLVAIVDPETDLDRIAPAPDDEDGVLRPSVASYEYFREKVEDHVVLDGTFSLLRMERLFEALKDGLAVVSIELEGGDDAQTIFETLNSRGVDLSAGDLMRNFIFQRAKGLGLTGGSLNVDDLYRRHWSPLDGWFWREGETRGRQSKPRLDWLLTDHLSMKQGGLVSVDALFESYRRWILNDRPFASVEAELESISNSAAVERRLMQQEQDDALGRFGSFARAFDVSTAMPLVLYLATDGGLGDDIRSALTMIESFILRRDICGLTTKNYNRIFVDIVGKVRNSDAPTLVALNDELVRSTADSARWPDDAEWLKEWQNREQYKGARQARIRYILESIEMAKRSRKNEDIQIRSALTIEHIMPRNWKEHWPLQNGEDVDASALLDLEQVAEVVRRDRLVNTIGNLTLLTGSLNPSVSNGSFGTKLPAVRAYSSLALNRDLEQYDHWDEETIQHRGAALFKIAQQIWPNPTARNTAVGLR